ncbi:MAG: hypothetical protein KME26_17455 [Oscillatoria princeps RMCB-10]|nr:hypothetical protein [Oscillatoria princeps RMCB-10]
MKSISLAKILRDYSQQKPDAYCALASKDSSASADRLVAGVAGSPPSQASSKPLPEQAVRDYYSTINSGNYTEKPGRGRARGPAPTKPGFWHVLHPTENRYNI